LDLKAAVGVPITAPAPGVVVLAKDLYFTGGTVVLDHGYGVFTIYAHLSKVGVKVGKKVEQREILGLAGATGRVSGPHLHWTTQVSGVKVNPTEFVRVVQ
jgi:murein DD-endopeptidase MepM/ murein hydrolase activator NlpD